jgi:triosephosphate isomerase (TIM)
MKKIVIANLKMSMDYEKAKSYVEQLKGQISDSVEVVICPSNPFMYLFKTNEYKLGAQNVYYTNDPYCTGEVSVQQFKSIGTSHIIVGHSERRMYLQESNDNINKKIKAILSNNLKTVLCIGETKEERNMHKTTIVIKKQIEECLKNIDKDMLSDIIIAYEPIWAIGNGLTPTTLQIEEVVNFIKSICNAQYHTSNIKVLYGGSVNKNNIKEITNIKELDGVLVGTASWEAKSLIDIINIIK